ncbi:MAG: MMPL family transporter [Bacteroidetes bacterium]|nr:MMPL family transporter [Bacteroidota bacterium]
MSVKKAYLLIIAVGLISLFCFTQLSKVRFDYDLQNFFSKKDKEWLFYKQYSEQYGQDDDYLLIGIETETGVFNQTFLHLADSLAKVLVEIEGVEKIISPISLRKFIQSPLGPVAVPYLHTNDPDRLKSDSLDIRTHPNLADYMINDEIGSYAFLIYHQRYADKQIEAELSIKIEETIAKFNFHKYHIAGRLKAQTSIIQLLHEDFVLFLIVSFTLIIGFLFAIFRKVKWVLTSLIIITLSIICCLATMAMMGQGIDVMSTMLPTILVVVAMSDIVHFLTRYFDMIAKGQSKAKAIQLTWKEVGLATFLTSLTTAVGFASLAITDSLPVRNLGIYTALGVFITYLITFSILPSIAVITKTAHEQRSHRIWNFILGKIFVLILRRTRLIIWIYCTLAVLSVWGMSTIVVDSPLIADFPKNHQITRDFHFFDQYYQGAKSFEVAIEVLDSTKSILDKEVIIEIKKVEDHLKDLFNIPNIASPASLVMSMNMAINGGRPEFYGLPEKDSNYPRIARNIRQIIHHLPSKIFNSEDPKKARITGLYEDLGSRAGLEKTEALMKFVGENTNTSLISFKRTGTSNLFELTIKYLIENILYGLTIGMLAVAFIMALLFRSLRMVVIALIPNILPIVLVAGIMGFTGIPLRLSTSVIFAVAFGIAVDNAIHFLSKYKIELSRGQSNMHALMHTTLTTGKAMIVTTLILFCGFIIFTFSSFEATFYTGLFISITLVFALITSLTLLPVLLIIWRKK